MARHTINRDFLETIRQAGGTGRYQEYADAAFRGFGVKLTPRGGIGYYYRWTQPNGTHGRKTIGHYPGVAPRAAQDLAKKHAATLERSRDDDVTLMTKRAGGDAHAERARVVPTVGEFLSEKYAPYFRTKSKTNADRRFVIDGLLPTGLTYFAGRPKGGQP